MNLESGLYYEREESRKFVIDPTGKWLLVVNQKFDAFEPIRFDPENGIHSSKTAFNFSCGIPIYLLFLPK